jgi:hypothetical protein
MRLASSHLRMTMPAVLEDLDLMVTIKIGLGMKRLLGNGRITLKTIFLMDLAVVVSPRE